MCTALALKTLTSNQDPLARVDLPISAAPPSAAGTCRCCRHGMISITCRHQEANQLCRPNLRRRHMIVTSILQSRSSVTAPSITIIIAVVTTRVQDLSFILSLYSVVTSYHLALINITSLVVMMMMRMMMMISLLLLRVARRKRVFGVKAVSSRYCSRLSSKGCRNGTRSFRHLAEQSPFHPKCAQPASCRRYHHHIEADIPVEVLRP